jgi:hypothetical protein
MMRCHRRDDQSTTRRAARNALAGLADAHARGAAAGVDGDVGLIAEECVLDTADADAVGVEIGRLLLGDGLDEDLGLLGSHLRVACTASAQRLGLCDKETETERVWAAGGHKCVSMRVAGSRAPVRSSTTDTSDTQSAADMHMADMRCTASQNSAGSGRSGRTRTLNPGDVAQRLPSRPWMAPWATFLVPMRLLSTYACQDILADGGGCDADSKRAGRSRERRARRRRAASRDAHSQRPNSSAGDHARPTTPVPRRRGHARGWGGEAAVGGWPAAMRLCGGGSRPAVAPIGLARRGRRREAVRRAEREESEARGTRRFLATGPRKARIQDPRITAGARSSQQTAGPSRRVVHLAATHRRSPLFPLPFPPRRRPAPGRPREQYEQHQH